MRKETFRQVLMSLLSFHWAITVTMLKVLPRKLCALANTVISRNQRSYVNGEKLIEKMEDLC